MKRLLRTRIRGVSFHIRRPGISTAGPKEIGSGRRYENALFPGNPHFPEAAAGIVHGVDTPAILSQIDLHRLMADFTRHELHALVIDAIDGASRWKQLCETLERLAGPNEESRVWHEQELDVLLGARRTQRLWRHQLEILEMIADAQRTLVAEARRSSR